MINENLHSLSEGKQAVNEDFFVAEAARRRRRILQTGFFIQTKELEMETQ